MERVTINKAKNRLTPQSERKTRKSFLIKSTEITPLFALEAGSQTLLIEGVSKLENPNEFYDKVMNLINDFIQPSTYPFTFSFCLSYFNTASARCIYNLMIRLKELKSENCNINVNWYYSIEDDDILLAGKNFSSYTELDMKLIPTSLYQNIKDVT